MGADDRFAWLHAREQELLGRAQDLDTWRSSLHRLPFDQRIAREHELDRLRGALNRAMARLEHARQASGDAWDPARANAETAFRALRAACAGTAAADQQGAAVAA